MYCVQYVCAIGFWQLMNEIGTIHWVVNESPKKRYRKWFLNRTRIANNALLLYTLCWVNKLMRKPSSHIVRIISQCVDYHKETWTIIVYIGRFHYVAPSGVSYNMHPYINCTKACTYYSGIMRVMYCYISQHWGSDLRGHYAVVLAGARAISRDIFYV
jgi:hypothetical protein